MAHQNKKSKKRVRKKAEKRVFTYEPKETAIDIKEDPTFCYDELVSAYNLKSPNYWFLVGKVDGYGKSQNFDAVTESLVTKKIYEDIEVLIKRKC